ncbi:MAG TPA: AmpG family muropeptide MFS transporter [Candidatus Wallbacteria bacterium]|nr:AmpG family muropeptide MFS transporter [Candidatus Wallbacteria bacterium]
MSNTISRYAGVFKSRKLMALLILGFSSGLPFYLTNKTAQAWMTLEKMDLASIGFISLAGLPYSLKFLWSPLIDRFSIPVSGRRLGWVFTMQIILAALIASMFFLSPAASIKAFAAVTLLIAFFSATQDIAFDAYKIEVLEKHELGAGVALSVLGYRAALIATSAAAFVMADNIGWRKSYLAIAAVIFILSLITLRYFREEHATAAPADFKEAVIMPFAEFSGRLGFRETAMTLVFIALYKYGDSLVSNMSTSFLMLTGFSQTEIGALSGGIGMFATMAGVVAGGAFLSSAGIKRSLLAFGILQGASNFMYYALYIAGKNYYLMAATMVIENLCAGLGTAAFVAYIMSLCSKKFSATQYALLTSLMAVSRDILVAPAGKMVNMIGFGNFFILTVILSIPGTAMLIFMKINENGDDIETAKKIC